MKQIKQTGLLFKLRPTDFILGSNSPLSVEEVNAKGDWDKFLPAEEKQNKPFVFDTMSCSTFSGLSEVETWLKFYSDGNLIPDEYVSYLESLGFDMFKEFNGSDRYTAIMSGTTKQGNYIQSIWDSFRNHGILAEQFLPFNPDFNTWEEYHDKKKITNEMIEKAKKINDVFEFSYEFISLTADEMDKIAPALKTSPLHAGIPARATHAVMIYKDGYYFDTYDPFKKKYTKVGYTLRGLVKIRDPKKVYSTMRVGSKGLDVKRLQRLLNIKDDGIFGKNTKLAVTIFQAKNGLTIDGVVGSMTRAYLNNL